MEVFNMKKTSRLLAILMTLALVVVLIPAFAHKKTTEVQAAAFAITSPTFNQLVPGGSFDVEWTAPSESVTEYTVYMDDVEQGTTTDTKYECYTTSVAMHTLRVEAQLANGHKEETSTKFALTKKGLGLSSDMGAKCPTKDMGISWYYNWGDSGPSSGNQYKGIEYVPMVWKSTTSNDFKTRVNRAKNNKYRHILTFNEPDLQGQCNMTVSAVYGVWQGLDGMAQKDGIEISSPVTALWPKASQDDSWKPWFGPFMDKLDDTDYKPDFISIHCYPDNYGGSGMANWFMENVIDWTWEKYHLPIWVTEFSTTGNSVTATGANGTKEFWETVMPLLDANEHVERYAAFGFNADNNPPNGYNVGLWHYSTGELTAGGEVYKELGLPEGYDPHEEPEVPYTTEFSTRRTLLDNSGVINGKPVIDYITQGGTATASTTTSGNLAEYAIDDSITTRWESPHALSEAYLQIDLGQVRNIKKVSIIWEEASASDYRIEVSDDGTNFEQVAVINGATKSQNRLDETTFDKMFSGRYVRIYGYKKTSEYGYSIYDVALYGTDDPSIDETTTPVSTTAKPTTVKPTTTKAPTTTVTTTVAPTTVTTVKPTAKPTVKPTTKKPKAPGKVKIKKKVTRKKRSLKIKYGKVKGAKGYQIKYSDNKWFDGYWIKNTKKTKYTLKKLDRSTTYHIKIRAYKMNGKAKLYGKWSKKKKASTK